MNTTYTKRIPVYLMPGLAASPEIFEYIRLPEEKFELHLLEWFVPEPGMTLEGYAREMASKIDKPGPVLIGVSFGGMLVQEMARFLDPLRTIIVSSVKTRNELPRRMMMARRTGLHKLLPTRLVNNVDFLARYAFGETINKRLELYEKYLAVRDPDYLDWAIDQVVNWDREVPEPGLIHIHGDQDAVFPIARIGPCIQVPGGTHTMIIHRYRWFNEHLPQLILQ